MKSTKKIMLGLIVFFTLLNSSIFADDALVWGYFTDINYNGVDGLVVATSTGYQSDSLASGFYMLYLTAGNYTVTAAGSGYLSDVIQLTVEDDHTYQLDFTLQSE